MSHTLRVNRSLFALLCMLVAASYGVTRPQAALGQPGRDGTKAVTTVNTVVNAYSRLNTDVAAGATSLTVANIAELNGPAAFYNNTALQAGDLVAIYQAQGATINTTDSAAYGAVTALNSAGRYELVPVASVSGNTIQVDVSALPGGLRFGYTTAGNAQVIRVPQFQSLTVNAGMSVVPAPWDGQRGGVALLAVNGTLTVDGSISAAGRGFRGGAVEQNTSAGGAGIVATFRSANGTDGAEKGEGVAGSQAAYDALNGRFGRGAPANGGGGGNGHNAGGGGGGGGGDVAQWTGQGVMDNHAAWALDPWVIANLGVRSNSTGGGRGGYSYSANNSDALLIGPSNALWGGDNRDDVGGWGGRPIGPNLSQQQLFFGGGGGAGDSNNSTGTPGGAGGGAVIILARTVTGTGTIDANGASAANTTGAGNDAPGGGGGGGGVLVSARTLGGVTLRANGGNGGTQSITTNEAEGPGGGGGGGVVASVGGTVTTSVTGGVCGTTNSPSLTEWTANGASNASAGAISTAPGCLALSFCPLDLSTTVDLVTPANGAVINDSTPTLSGTAEAGATVAVSVDGAPIGTVTADAAGNWTFTASTPLADGAHSVVVTATDTSGNTATETQTFTLDSAVALTVTAPADGSQTNDTTPTLSGTTDPNATVTFSYNGNDAGTATADASGNWSFTASVALTDGNYIVSVTAEDAAGNTASTALSFTVDTSTTVNLVTPANDAVINDNTPTLSGTAEVGATVAVSVDGTPIGTATTDAAGNWTLTASTPLADGAHVVAVTATDALGNTATDSHALTVDTAITLTVAAPADGSATNDTTPTATGTTDPGATITITYGGINAGTATADAAGNWSFTSPVPLSDGTYDVVITAEDGAGNTTSTTLSFTVDTATTLTVASPSDGDTLNDATPTFSGTAEAGATVAVSVGGQVIGAVTADASGSWSFTPSAPLPGGPQSVSVTATDGAGNTATDAFAVIIVLDACADPSANNCAANATCTAVDGGFTCACKVGYAGDGVTCDDIDECADPSANTCAEGATCTNTDGGFTCACNPPLVGDGFTCEPDVIPPWVLVEVPVANATLLAPLGVISGEAEPGAVINVYVDGALVGTTTAAEDGSWSVALAEPAGEGAHTVRVTATDAAGNTSQQVTQVEVVIGEAVVITGPADGATVRTGSPVVSGKADPGATVTILVDGEAVGTVTADENGAWTWTPDQPLADGQVTITAQVEVNGNPVADVITVTIDTTTVGVAVNQPVDGSVTNDPRPTFSGTSAPGAEVVITTPDGTVIATVTADENGAWTWTPDQNIPNGEQAFTITATDRDGNVSTDDVTVTIDTVPPAVRVNEPSTGGSVPSTGVTVSGTSEPGVVINVYVDGELVGTTTAGDDGSWSLDLAGPLPAGEVTLQVTGTDDAGNVTITDVVVTVSGSDDVGDTSGADTSGADTSGADTSGTAEDTTTTGDVGDTSGADTSGTAEDTSGTGDDTSGADTGDVSSPQTVLEGGCTCQSVQTQGDRSAPLGAGLALMAFGLIVARARRRR